MITINFLTQLLGWCSVINIFVLTLTTISIVSFNDFITRIHGKMFSVDKNRLNELYFRYLSSYKIITVCFFIIPYISFKLSS